MANALQGIDRGWSLLKNQEPVDLTVNRRNVEKSCDFVKASTAGPCRLHTSSPTDPYQANSRAGAQ